MKLWLVSQSVSYWGRRTWGISGLISHKVDSLETALRVCAYARMNSESLKSLMKMGYCHRVETPQS